MKIILGAKIPCGHTSKSKGTGVECARSHTKHKAVNLILTYIPSCGWLQGVSFAMDIKCFMMQASILGGPSQAPSQNFGVHESLRPRSYT